MEVELVIDAKATLGEGAIWDCHQQRLYWVDIDEGELHVYDPVAETDQGFRVGQKVGTVVPRKSGGLMLAVENGFAAFDPQSRQLTIIHDPESTLSDNRFNDGKCDPAGRFWAGTMSLVGQQRAGALYCMELDHSVRRVLDGVTTSNGLVWSSDRTTMYYIDTPTLEVAAFDYRLETGEIANRRAVITFPDGVGRPDGMAIDSDDMLWIAHWTGGRVTQWDPRTGELLQTIPIPASRVTSCAFGGAGLDELYVTTARFGLTAEQLEQEPFAGGLFRARPGAVGVEADRFGG